MSGGSSICRPSGIALFYNSQRFTLNITRSDMVAAGWSPSVRLFEAAACGVPVISDAWPGLSEFFRRDSEILIGASGQNVQDFLTNMSEEERRGIGEAARRRVLAGHTASCRARELETHLLQLCRAEQKDMTGDPQSRERV